MSQSTTSTYRGTAKEGLEHHRAGRLSEAEQLYKLALCINPNDADCLHLLGMVAYQTERHAVAVDLIRKAIALNGTAASYHSNLGNVLQAQRNMAEARSCYERALAIKPDQAEVHLNLGHILKAQGELDAGLASYRRAIALKQHLAEAHVAESTALLLGGNYSTGWHNFELRWQTQDYDTLPRTYRQPKWGGERLNTGRVLIWGEQGIGDEVMFAGLIPDILRGGNRCVLDCDLRLKPLFERSFPEVEVVSRYDPELHAKLDIAAHLPSGSLPGLFRTDHKAFGATKSPYLTVDPLDRKRLRCKYGDRRPLVGVAWRSTNKKSGRERSVDLALLAPLFSRADVQWISLQYGDHDTLEQQVDTAGTSLLVDRTVDQLTDIDAYATQVSVMDLVITIDNTTAHMAGALGIPTWVLLPFSPDWRWLLGRTDSLWYPTIRLFRQPSPGDWYSVLQQVQDAFSLIFHRP